jgi:hypothetical protein
MQLRARIVIEMEAADFAEAADHQRRLEAVFNDVRHTYRDAKLEFKHRRARVARTAPGADGRVHYTGRMKDY